MKCKLLMLSTLMPLCFISAAYGDDVTVCRNGQNERVISVVYPVENSQLPCEVVYKKASGSQTLWRASTELGYCEVTANAFIEKQIAWGWTCVEGAESASSEKILPSPSLQQEPSQAQDPSFQKSLPPVEEEILPVVQNVAVVPVSDEFAIIGEDKYKVRAAVSHAITIVAPLKKRTSQHANQTGAFPTKLEDIGLKPRDMKTSEHLSDIRLGENGEILIKGNLVMGLNTVIMLSPHISLGGISIEWQCFVNIQIYKMNICEYNQYLKF